MRSGKRRSEEEAAGGGRRPENEGRVECFIILGDPADTSVATKEIRGAFVQKTTAVTQNSTFMMHNPQSPNDV